MIFEGKDVIADNNIKEIEGCCGCFCECGKVLHIKIPDIFDSHTIICPSCGHKIHLLCGKKQNILKDYTTEDIIEILNKYKNKDKVRGKRLNEGLYEDWSGFTSEEINKVIKPLKHRQYVNLNLDLINELKKDYNISSVVYDENNNLDLNSLFINNDMIDFINGFCFTKGITELEELKYLVLLGYVTKLELNKNALNNKTQNKVTEISTCEEVDEYIDEINKPFIEIKKMCDEVIKRNNLKGQEIYLSSHECNNFHNISSYSNLRNPIIDFSNKELQDKLIKNNRAFKEDMKHLEDMSLDTKVLDRLIKVSRKNKNSNSNNNSNNDLIAISSNNIQRGVRSKHIYFVDKNPMIFAFDFDGTLCEEEFPNIGKEKIRTIELVKKLKEQGHYIILWTCRTGKELNDATEWCKERGLVFDAINENIKMIKDKYEINGMKVTADYYIDDKAINVDNIEDLKTINDLF